MSFVSASKAVQVQIEPTPGIPRISSGRFLGVAEAPLLVTLQAAAIKVAQHLVLEGEAGFAQPAGEPLDSILGNAGHADGKPIDQAADYGTTLFVGLCVHDPIMLDHSSIVNGLFLQ